MIPRKPLAITFLSTLTLVAATVPTTASAAIGDVCAAINLGNFAACVECVVEACEMSGGDVALCVFEHGVACFPALPLPNGDTVPDIDIGTDTLWNYLVIAGASAGTGYVLYQNGGRIMAWLTTRGPSMGYGMAPAMVLIGLPMFLGDTAAHAFEDYVQNYAPCVNPVYDGNTYVCLGNSVATGPGAPGSSCPPGTQPQTGMYGTACVEMPNFTPPTPSCASLMSCEERAASPTMMPSCGGESFDVELECIADGGATATAMSCLTLCEAEADGPPAIAP